MSRPKTTEVARGRWRGILLALGVDPKFLENRHQSCPFCGGKDRFRFDDKEGNGTFFCSQCGAGRGMDFVMRFRNWNFAWAAQEVDALIGQIPAAVSGMLRTDEQKLAAIFRLLKRSSPLTPGNISWQYLEARCGPLNAFHAEVLADLRHHPALINFDANRDHFPGLLGLLRGADNQIVSLHRTYLTSSGEKAPLAAVRKLMPGLPIAGAAVRLSPTLDRIGIAEGIETALCAGKLFGVPVWSAISANGLSTWEPPRGVRSVLIAGDNDSNFTGQEAAISLAKKLRGQGFDVEVEIPPDVGTDWADVWARKSKEVP
jgi:putative DNA primase/helicase